MQNLSLIFIFVYFTLNYHTKACLRSYLIWLILVLIPLKEKKKKNYFSLKNAFWLNKPKAKIFWGRGGGEGARGGEQGGKKAKNGPKWQKIMSVSLYVSETVHLILWFLVHICKMMRPPGNLFIFQNFDFGGF